MGGVRTSGMPGEPALSPAPGGPRAGLSARRGPGGSPSGRGWTRSTVAGSGWRGHPGAGHIVAIRPPPPARRRRAAPAALAGLW